MKYHTLHDLGTSALFKEKSSDHCKDPHILKFLTNFDVSLTSSPGGVTNLTFNTLFINHLRNEVRLASKFVKIFSYEDL